MRKRKIAWKRNLRQIPNHVLTKAKNFRTNDLIVACVKKIPESAITSGKYSHISLAITNGKLTYPNSFVPKKSMGKYSDWNVNGHEIIRHDLPKITKTYSWDSPNWGDWFLGSHEVSIDREVFKRTFIPPRLLEIQVALLGEELKDEKHFVIKFTVDEVLDTSARKFKDSLLYDLNLLQENVGAVDVFQSDAKLSDYLKTIYVHWEILPPGERDKTIRRIYAGFRTQSRELKTKLIARYDLLARLKPVAFIAGTSGFRRYFGAKFSDRLVVFENLEYGNAIYAMGDQWEKLSKMSRIDLLASDRKGFVRIVHTTGWEPLLKKVIKQRR